jgi:hypothetical protein
MSVPATMRTDADRDQAPDAAGVWMGILIFID